MKKDRNTKYNFCPYCGEQLHIHVLKPNTEFSDEPHEMDLLNSIDYDEDMFSNDIQPLKQMFEGIDPIANRHIDAFFNSGDQEPGDNEEEP